MRIALDTQSTLGRKTGIGQYTCQLLAALRRAAPQHEFVELHWGHDPPMRLDRRLRWQQWEVPRRARRAGARLLHVPGFDAPLWPPVPVVVTVHDLIGMLFAANFPPVSRFYWSRWLPFTVRAAHAILADSAATQRDLERLLGIPSAKITVAYPGVEPRFQPQPPERVAAVRERHGLPPRYVLYVGTLEPRKGLDTLLDAFAALPQAEAGALAIVGKRGWHWQPLLAQMTALSLVDRVRLLDYVPDDDLPGLYAGAAVVVLPSRYEGFGLPVLEGMACGAPVVCSNAASLPEVAGQAALLAPPDDPRALAAALGRVLADPALAAELGAAGLAQARRFTWDQTAQTVLGVYERVLSA